MTAKPTCPKHPGQTLVCPSCVASQGGKTTAKLHGDKAREWGKKGGRPRIANPKRPRKVTDVVNSQTTEAGQ